MSRQGNTEMRVCPYCEKEYLGREIDNWFCPYCGNVWWKDGEVRIGSKNGSWIPIPLGTLLVRNEVKESK